MKKNNTAKRGPKQSLKGSVGTLAIALELGDKSSRYRVLHGTGEVVREASVASTKKGMQTFAPALPERVGTHSPGWTRRRWWTMRTRVVNAVRRLVKSLGERLPACDTDSLEIECLAAFTDAGLFMKSAHVSKRFCL